MSYELMRELYASVLGVPTIKEKLAFDATATSAVLVENTTYRIMSDQDCHIVVSAAPTATTGMTPLPAWAPEYIHTPLGSELKIAAIKNATAGNLYISTMAADRV